MESIVNKVQHARDMFSISTYPGNLFERIVNTPDYIDKYNLVIFKEDLDKLSGFIGYKEKYSYIAINYKRPIGHQNLTIAHEIGHLFLHHNECFADNIIEGETIFNDIKENEAYQFGMELLYPTQYFEKDLKIITDRNLLDISNAKELAVFINELCHKYYLSFTCILNKVLYKKYLIKDRNKYKEEMKKSLGYNYTQMDKNFHVALDSNYSVPDNRSYIYLKQLAESKLEKHQISRATMESIFFQYSDMLEETNE